MASGRQHATAGAVLCLPVGTAVWLTTNRPEWGLLAAAGCLAGVAVHPDLDQEGVDSSEYAIIKWTLGVGFVWTALWYPYARLLRHRSFWSHFPLVGTLGRLAYLYVAVWLASRVFKFALPSMGVEFVIVGIGLCVSDTAHFVMDKLGRRRHEKRRRFR